MTTIMTTIPHAPQKDHDAGAAGAYEVLEEAVRSLLIEKGVLSPQEIAGQRRPDGQPLARARRQGRGHEHGPTRPSRNCC